MKKVTLLCVGRIKEKYLSDGIAEYSKRLARFCDFAVEELPDESGDVAVKKESDALLKRIKGFTVLCDIEGKTLSSPELADTLDKAYISSPEVTFIIGGSEGVDARVRERADIRVSFGRVTYPHQLMRLILTEQIYRAFNIISGTPYHK